MTDDYEDDFTSSSIIDIDEIDADELDDTLADFDYAFDNEDFEEY